MRELKQVRNYVGLALILTVGPQAQVQQARQVVRPTEKITIEPASMAWSDMLHMQASLPAMATLVPGEPSVTVEPPISEIEMKGGPKLLPTQPSTGVEKLGTCPGFGSEPPVSGSFDSQLDVADGMGFSFIPPDVAGAVGPNHLMTMLNNQVLISDRLGGSPVAVDTSVFWSSLGTTPASPTHVYPRVFFDGLDGRWLASIRNGIGSLGATSIFFAISQTDDPTGTWDFYAIAADPGATSQADWVQLGYNGTWITFVANMFNLAGTGFLGVKMWAIDKATALVPGGPITVSVFATGITTAVHGSGGNSVMPARTLDANPTLWMVNTAFTSSGNFLAQLTQMTGTGPAPVVSGMAGSPFGGTTSFCVLSTNFSGTQRTMSQVGEPRFITPFSTRVASVAVRNGKIWMAQSGGLPGPSSNTAPTSNGVIWHEIDPSLPFPGTIPPGPGTMPVQSSAITNGTDTMSMYPSIAVNCAEDVLIGYANGDATRSPRACYSIRLGTDAPNFMGAIQELKAGESVYWKNFGVGTTAQYGRYTAAAVDPVDDTTMWTLQEYADQRVGPADNDSRWGTHWGRLGECGEPSISDDPDSIAVCIGDPASFSVVASPSLAPLGYQWRKDGVAIPGANADTYSIGSTVASDAASYDVIVYDGCGNSLSLPAALSFAGASISSQPGDLVVKSGDPASFTVVATGTGTLGYQWQLNGNPIPLANADTYAIAAVTAADYGNYTVIVTDDCGPVTSDVAKLEPPVVNHAQPADLSFHIFESPKSQLGCVLGSVTLEVKAYPAGVTYEWRKDGSPIVPAETGSTLTLNALTAGDAGSYDVVVSLGSRARTSAAATLTIGDKPVITTEPGPSSQTVAPGSSVTYTVVATGAVSYQWKKKSNAPFTSYNDIPGATGPELTIEPINAGDAGLYRCHVRNECGQTISNACRIIVD